VTKSVSIEIGDTEYEVRVPYYYFGVPPHDWDPGAGSEIELDKLVLVWDSDANGLAFIAKKILLEDFIKIYAESEQIDDLKKAESKLEERCLEYISQQMMDEYDDRDV
jgi:hypothetical protein